MPASIWGRPRFILLLATALLAACGAPDEVATKNVASPAPAQAVAPERIAAAERALAGESKFRAIAYEAPRWRLSVDDDGSSRNGLAEYACLLIGEQGARLEVTEVEIIDQGDAGRRLGFSRCSSAA